MIIKKIEANSYKSLINFSLEVNPKLNILIGANNVGKSNILKLLDIFFNKKKLAEQDFPKNIKYRLNFNNEGLEKGPYIELTFVNLSDQIKKKYADYIIENKLIIVRAVFDKVGTFKGYFIKHSKNNGYSNLAEEILPYYIYLGDVNQREITLEYIMNIIPKESEARKNFVTYSNQFLKNTLDSALMVSIDKNDEEYEINVIDEFGTMNDLVNKSSGVQQMVFMALILSSNLDGEPKRRIFAYEEPEMNLHAGIQKKLFNQIRSNSDNVQTFVTTHSPIFIDKANNGNVFHIGRNIDNVTIRIKNNLGDNWYKIKTDLGLSINDNLFLGDINIIVEGTTEKILFPHIIDILNEEGIIHFNSDQVNILSAESANNVKYFADVVTQQTNLNSIAILDDDREGNNSSVKIQNDINLKQRVEILQFTRDGFEESEIEDILNDEYLIEALNTILKITINVEEFEQLRLNEHTQQKIKFNKLARKLEEKYEVVISKTMLAHELKNLIKTSNDLSGFIETFKKIDTIIKHQQKN